MSTSPSIELKDTYFSLAWDMLCAAGYDGRLVETNPAWEQTLGWTAPELQAKSLFEWTHPDDHEKLRSAFTALQATSEPVTFDCRFLCKDGTYRILHWRALAAPEGQRFQAAVRAQPPEPKGATVSVEYTEDLRLHTIALAQDLRDPILMVKNYVQELVRRHEGKLDDDSEELLRFALDGACWAQELVRSLLRKSFAGSADGEFH